MLHKKTHTLCLKNATNKTFFSFSFWASILTIYYFSSALVPVHIETPGKSLFDYVRVLVVGPSATGT